MVADKTTALEQQVAELQAQITLLTKSKTTSLSKRLQNIRSECREKYFGTWDEIRNGKVQYGPDSKTYSDYNAILEIVKKTTDLLFRYSKGKSNSEMTVTSLIKSEKDLKEYEEVCDKVCHELKEKILHT